MCIYINWEEEANKSYLCLDIIRFPSTFFSNARQKLFFFPLQGKSKLTGKFAFCPCQQFAQFIFAVLMHFIGYVQPNATRLVTVECLEIV